MNVVNQRIDRKKLSAFLVLGKCVHFRSTESSGSRGTLRGSSEVIRQAEEFLLQHLCPWTEGPVKAGSVDKVCSVHALLSTKLICLVHLVFKVLENTLFLLENLVFIVLR